MSQPAVHEFDSSSLPRRERYFDRELSWLEFNQRVLDRALDPETPLIERLKFLAITGSNLDEFFRVRVGSLHVAIREGIARTSLTGMTPQEQLQAIWVRVDAMLADQYACLAELEPLLSEAGMQRVRPEHLTNTQQRVLRTMFDKEVSSVLAPASVSTEDAFPHLPNELVHVFLKLRPSAETQLQVPVEEDGFRYALIPASRVLSRFVSIPTENGFAYILMEDVIRHFAPEFFPGDEVIECVPFRCLRNAEVDLQEYSPAGLYWEMEETLQGRAEADWLRLDVPAEASEEVIAVLRQLLRLTRDDAHRVSGPMDLGAFMSIASRQGFDKLKYEPWPAVVPPTIPAEQLMFDILADRDVLLYHPYDSYDPVIRFLEEAAEDPDVLAIKQTLYRVSRDSKVVQALIRAVENGKHVTVLVELKARFDEARNLRQAAELEAAGAHVIWGVKGYKTHAKVCIVVRREPHGIQRYMHFGTGNYNEVTSRIYSDVSLLTAGEDLGADAVSFFNAIAGYSHPQRYRRL
ncbi:MAG: polyphosphate kinase 1, partial [Planctomycetaceae bacterium]|nr:polyphosphate kinase 1 [Planctomycetaceae bacterium]